MNVSRALIMLSLQLNSKQYPFGLPIDLLMSPPIVPPIGPPIVPHIGPPIGSHISPPIGPFIGVLSREAVQVMELG